MGCRSAGIPVEVVSDIQALDRTIRVSGNVQTAVLRDQLQKLGLDILRKHLTGNFATNQTVVGDAHLDFVVRVIFRKPRTEPHEMSDVFSHSDACVVVNQTSGVVVEIPRNLKVVNLLYFGNKSDRLYVVTKSGRIR